MSIIEIDNKRAVEALEFRASPWLLFSPGFGAKEKRTNDLTPTIFSRT